jgi:hypothetical protein
MGDRRALAQSSSRSSFPLLVMLYIGAFEITIGLSVSKRVTRSPRRSPTS